MGEVTRWQNACFKRAKEKAAGPEGPAAKGEPDKYKGEIPPGGFR